MLAGGTGLKLSEFFFFFFFFFLGGGGGGYFNSNGFFVWKLNGEIFLFFFFSIFL